MAALSAFLLCREVCVPMSKRGQGTIIFTGATASIRKKFTSNTNRIVNPVTGRNIDNLNLIKYSWQILSEGEQGFLLSVQPW